MNACELLRRETGLALTPAETGRAVARRLAATGCRDEASYLAALGPAELAALIELVVVPESWLFRDPEAFATAAAVTRQRAQASPLRVQRLLSIPCAGGEEPYSLAMALADAGLDPGAWQIDAVDLSAASIARARSGRFTRNAFRGSELAFRERHFRPAGDDYDIDPALRAQVNFSQGNLFSFEAGTLYDLVFCRNLLIYFDAEGCARAAARIGALLRDDGLLFAGYAEVPVFTQHGFEATAHRATFALQKRGRRPASAAARPAAPRPAGKTAPPRVPPAPATAPAVPAADPARLLAEARRAADRNEGAAASAACHAALAIDPNSAQAYFMLGMLATDEREAGAHWRRCVYLEPGHYEALCHLALLAEREGDAAQARTLRQRAARVHQKRSAP